MHNESPQSFTPNDSTIEPRNARIKPTNEGTNRSLGSSRSDLIASSSSDSPWLILRSVALLLFIPLFAIFLFPTPRLLLSQSLSRSLTPVPSDTQKTHRLGSTKRTDRRRLRQIRHLGFYATTPYFRKGMNRNCPKRTNNATNRTHATLMGGSLCLPSVPDVM